MSKLSKLYSMIANARELGIELGKDVYQQTDKLEEEIIKKEILPVIKEQIEPTLRQIKRDLTLVVDYVPDVSVRVRLSRESGIYNREDFVELTPDPQAEHGTRKGGKNMRFAIRAGVRGTGQSDEYQTDKADEALRLFDALSIAAKQIYLYDQVLLVEASGEREKLVERYRVWNDELFREERFQQLLDELHPAARV